MRSRWAAALLGTTAGAAPALAVRWHDGKSFTAAVKCTWDLLTGRSSENLRQLLAASCQGLTIQFDSLFSSWRMEDVWLNR
jgi:hypothetical protein